MARPRAQKKKEHPSQPLSNPKHELFAKNLIKRKLNQTKAYMDTYPASKIDSARSSASELFVKDNIQDRVHYLLQQSKSLNIEETLSQLSENIRATKTLVHSNDAVLTQVPDYSVRLDATKTVLKLHGLLKQENTVNIDARQQAVIAQPDEINTVISKLLELNKKFRETDSPSGVIEVESGGSGVGG